MTGEPFDGCTHTPVHLHGEHRTYRTHACRCLLCRASHADNVSENRADRDAGRPRTVDAAPARAHIVTLRRSGLTLKDIAERAGVVSRTLTALLYGYPSRGTPPPARIHRTTSDAILAVVRPRYAHEATPTRRISALGSRRRLQALQANGWSLRAVGAACGMSSGTLFKVSSGSRISIRTAQRVADAYDRLWDQSPPDSTPNQRAAITYAKRRATENGWPPPMAWDDRNLDRPAGRPSIARPEEAEAA